MGEGGRGHGTVFGGIGGKDDGLRALLQRGRAVEGIGQNVFRRGQNVLRPQETDEIFDHDRERSIAASGRCDDSVNSRRSSKDLISVNWRDDSRLGEFRCGKTLVSKRARGRSRARSHG